MRVCAGSGPEGAKGHCNMEFPHGRSATIDRALPGITGFGHVESVFDRQTKGVCLFVFDPLNKERFRTYL